MARTSAELTPEEILIIGDLVPVWSPWQVPTVNAGGTGLEYKTPTGWDALTSNPLSQFASTTSAQLAGVISDETGSGSLVFATSPTLVTPVLGAATATSINGATITSGTLNGSVTGTNTGDQTVANTSNATSHTVTLSATGGSVKLVEWSWITLTTTGTSADWIVTIASTGGGSGDVVWPASATDNAIARFDSTTGKLIQNSTVTIDDSGNISGGSLSTTGNVNVNWTTEAALKTNWWIRMAGSSVRGVYDNSLNELIKFPLTDVASAVNEFTIKNAATTTWPILEATGWDTNIDININPKGTGRIKSGTVAVPTISSTDTLTNKTIALWSNTLTWTLSQFNTACTDADFATGWGTATGTNTGDNAPNTNSWLVHTTWVETIWGNKTFSNDVSIGWSFTVGSQIWSSWWTSFTATPTWSGGTTDPTMTDSQSAYKLMWKTLHIKIWLFYSGWDRTGATILLPTTVSSSWRTIFASWSTKDWKPFFPYAFNSQDYINCSGFTQSWVAELYISGTCETA